MSYHETVLKNEIVSYFVNKKNGIYLDVTCGGGGHSFGLLEAYPDITIIASDWDLNAVRETTKVLSCFGERAIVVQSSFVHIQQTLKKLDYTLFDGILADFGTSRYQLSYVEGFSFHHDSFLDMRMSNSHMKILAVDILAHNSEKDLADIFYYYGQERYAKRIARVIVEERKVKPIRTTMHLASVVKKAIGEGKPGSHPATKVFQALRIAVNKELEQIESLLSQVPQLLAPGGRLACISFHSLEDRLVKKFYMDHKKEFAIIGSDKIIQPTKEEIFANRAARSAKLRIIEKKN